jgi:hypothetical protein
MKHIEPIYIWKNGVSRTASILDAIITNDNLKNSCTFYWMLKEADQVIENSDPELNGSQTIVGETLAEGNVTVAGESYEDWDNSNEQAFELIAAQINVQLVD